MKSTLRTACAVFLSLLFAAFLVVPALQTVSNNDDASLPACCRAHGKHQCSGTMNAVAEKGTQPTVTLVREKCPYTPAAAPSQTHGSGSHKLAVSLTFAEVSSSPAIQPQTEAKRRISLDRCNGKRGPPTVHLPA